MGGCSGDISSTCTVSYVEVNAQSRNDIMHIHVCCLWRLIYTFLTEQNCSSSSKNCTVALKCAVYKRQLSVLSESVSRHMLDMKMYFHTSTILCNTIHKIANGHSNGRVCQSIPVNGQMPTSMKSSIVSCSDVVNSYVRTGFVTDCKTQTTGSSVMHGGQFYFHKETSRSS